MTTDSRKLVADLVAMMLPCNAQSPEMAGLEECPEEHPHCCGRCEVLHRARRALKARTHFFDPDFRRSPKTNRYCCVCQKDLAEGKGLQIKISEATDMEAVHPDDATPENSWDGWIGSDCAKAIPKEFIIKPS